MKRLIGRVMVVVLLLAMGLTVIAPQSVSAKKEGWGGKNAETVAISWTEHYFMYGPDGTFWWDGSYNVGPLEFKVNPSSKACRTTDMEAFMAGGTPPAEILGGFININGSGKLRGEITYISGGSGAKIYQEFWGRLTVTMTGSDTATMEGEYHDRIYVQQEDGSLVLAAYGDYLVTPLP